LAVQASDYMRYETVEELYVDIERDTCGYEHWTPMVRIPTQSIYGFAFLAVHDYEHYLTHSDLAQARSKAQSCQSSPQFRNSEDSLF